MTNLSINLKHAVNDTFLTYFEYHTRVIDDILENWIYLLSQNPMLQVKKFESKKIHSRINGFMPNNGISIMNKIKFFKWWEKSITHQEIMLFCPYFADAVGLKFTNFWSFLKICDFETKIFILAKIVESFTSIPVD